MRNGLLLSCLLWASFPAQAHFVDFNEAALWVSQRVQQLKVHPSKNGGLQEQETFRLAEAHNCSFLFEKEITSTNTKTGETKVATLFTHVPMRQISRDSITLLSPGVPGRYTVAMDAYSTTVGQAMPYEITLVNTAFVKGEPQVTSEQYRESSFNITFERHDLAIRFMEAMQHVARMCGAKSEPF